MKTKIKMFALFFTSGFVLGFLLSVLCFHRTSSIPTTPTVTPQKATELKESFAVTEYNVGKSQDSLKQQSTRLIRELKQTKTALDASKQKVHALQVQVFELLDSRFAVQQAVDSSGKSECDSLADVVPSLITASIEKDSLYEKAVVNLTSQLSVKDSVIGLKDSSYSKLKRSFENSLSAQQLLELQNTSLTKQAKRQKTKSKIVSAALFILTGAFANTLLQK